MPVIYPYPQYSGTWTTSQVTDAVAAGTWAVPPSPHLFSWGFNAYGALGLGNTTYYSSPKQVGALTNWLSVSCGDSNTVSIKTDGTLWSCGYNGFGQLGLSDTTDRSSPVQVGTNTWSKIAGGGYYTLAIRSDNTLWSCGYGASGILGTGSTSDQSSWTQAGSATTWIYVAAQSVSNMMAVKSDNTQWACGTGDSTVLIDEELLNTQEEVQAEETGAQGSQVCRPSCSAGQPRRAGQEGQGNRRLSEAGNQQH